MDYDVLPGPSLPELARTALARAAAAIVGDTNPLHRHAVGHAAVRDSRDGDPLLLPPAGSRLGQWLASHPDAVTVSVPANTPFSTLRLAGTAEPLTLDHPTEVTPCSVAIRSVEFVGPDCTPVPIADYRAAAPDPLWRIAPRVLRHLEHSHMGDLVNCVRAHGMPQADWVVPRDLDRYGLELLVLSTDGAAAIRLSFPDGPVTSLQEVPASIRTVLTCRCHAQPGHHHV